MHLTPDSDEKIILQQLSQGSEKAFTILFDKYRDKIYFFALSVTRSAFLAEEITQNVFLKLWQHRQEMATIDYFPSWLKTVARNDTYNYMKRLATEKLVVQNISLTNTSTDNSTQENLAWKEYRDIIAQAIDQLPEQQKKVFLFSRGQDMSYIAIAQEMQISVNTVKFHMKQALRFIKEQTELGLLIIITILFNN